MTTSHQPHQDEYSFEEVSVLQALWGDGFLSPGGEPHLDAIVGGLNLRDKLVLDIGCALGGYDLLLARKYGARVIGVDVETGLIEQGQRRVAAAGLADRVELRLIQPGPLPFPAAMFDAVFSKDSWLHIEDKAGLFAELFRVLKPGGQLAASDWCRQPGPDSPELLYFFEIEGLTYHMAALAEYVRQLQAAGFVDIRVQDFHAEYRAMAHEEHRRMQTVLKDSLVARIGEKWTAHYIEDWRAITAILDSGDLRPSRMWATKP